MKLSRVTESDTCGTAGVWVPFLGTLKIHVFSFLYLSRSSRLLLASDLVGENTSLYHSLQQHPELVCIPILKSFTIPGSLGLPS